MQLRSRRDSRPHRFLHEFSVRLQEAAALNSVAYGDYTPRACIYVYIYLLTNAYTYVCTDIYLYVYIYALYTYMYTYIYICIYTCDLNLAKR